MARVFIGLGSNIGNRTEFLQLALMKLSNLSDTKIVKTSSVYETEPVGIKEQPIFLNMVAEVATSILPKELMRELKNIEKSAGRTYTTHWGPREIDLDLLYYGDEILNDDNLQVPHPEIANRRFVLIPMKEIDENYFDPLRNMSVGELLHRCSDTSAVRKSVKNGKSQTNGVKSAITL